VERYVMETLKARDLYGWRARECSGSGMIAAANAGTDA
jgi:hypothetical protein